MLDIRNQSLHLLFANFYLGRWYCICIWNGPALLFCRKEAAELEKGIWLACHKRASAMI